MNRTLSFSAWRLPSVLAVACGTGVLASPVFAASTDLIMHRAAGPSCSAAALSGAADALASIDGSVAVESGRGELRVQLPPATPAVCAQSVEFVVTVDSSGAPNAITHVALADEGGSLAFPVPVSGQVTVDVALEGTVDGTAVTAPVVSPAPVWVSVDAVDDCLHEYSAMTFGSDLLTIDAATTPGTLSISVRPAEVPPCLDSATMTVTVLSDLEYAETSVEALSTDLKKEKGTSAVLALAPDDYLVYADIHASSDSDTSERQSFYARNGAPVTVTLAPNAPSTTSTPPPTNTSNPGATATTTPAGSPSSSTATPPAISPFTPADPRHGTWIAPTAGAGLFTSGVVLAAAWRLRRRVRRRSEGTQTPPASTPTPQ